MSAAVRRPGDVRHSTMESGVCFPRSARFKQKEITEVLVMVRRRVGLRIEIALEKHFVVAEMAGPGTCHQRFAPLSSKYERGGKLPRFGVPVIRQRLPWRSRIDRDGADERHIPALSFLAVLAPLRRSLSASATEIQQSTTGWRS